jgi:hypothetical protein
MVLTAILTAISDRCGVFAGVRCRTDSLTGKDFRTLAYGSGRGAGNLQARGQQFESACSHLSSPLVGLQQRIVEAFCCPSPLPVSTFFAPGLSEVYDQIVPRRLVRGPVVLVGCRAGEH